MSNIYNIFYLIAIKKNTLINDVVAAERDNLSHLCILIYSSVLYLHLRKYLFDFCYQYFNNLIIVNNKRKNLKIIYLDNLKILHKRFVIQK